MDDLQLLRYSRHLLLPQWDAETQQQLAASRVLLVGAGGLGCAVAPYLVAAGLGVVHIVDDDAVDLSNLQRQILYGSASIGQAKAEAARQRLLDLNPEVRVVPHVCRLDADWLSGMDVDLVLDGSDNFETRHSVNAFCVRRGIGLVSGAALGWQGQLAVFDPKQPETGCYACLYHPGPDDEGGQCSHSGVIGPLVGIIGSMMALEALKWLGKIEQSAVGKLIVYDAQHSSFRQVRLRQDPDCPVCANRQLA